MGTPGFGFGPPPTLPTGTTSLFTPGTSKDGTTYTDAIIISLLRMWPSTPMPCSTRSWMRFNSYNELETGKRSNFHANDLPLRGADPHCQYMFARTDQDLPGSICGFQALAEHLSTQLSPPLPPDNTLSASNDYLAQTQTLVSQLDGLAGGMNQAALPVRAIAFVKTWRLSSACWARPAAPTPTTSIHKNGLQFVDSTDGLYRRNLPGTLRRIDAGNASLHIATGYRSDQAEELRFQSAGHAVCHAMGLYAMGQFCGVTMLPWTRRRPTLWNPSRRRLSCIPAFQIAMATLNPSAFLTNRRNDPANLLAVIPGPSSSYRRGNLSDLSRGNSFEDITQVSEQRKLTPKSVKPTDKSGDENPPPDNSSAYPILTGPKCPNPNTTAGCTNQNWVVDTGPTQNIVEQLFKELLKMREQVGDLDGEGWHGLRPHERPLRKLLGQSDRCVAAAHQQHHRSHRHQRAAKLHAVHPDRRRNGRHSWGCRAFPGNCGWRRG